MSLPLHWLKISYCQQYYLTTVSNSPDDPLPLCPAMLLTRKDHSSSTSLENYDENDILAYGKRRYRRVQYVAEQFWKRWRVEYLQTLAKRNKWKKRRRCITEGDVVLIRNKTAPHNQWPMGIVCSVKTSQDGLVRSATVSLAPLPGSNSKRFFNRAVTDLILLIEGDNPVL